MIIFFIEDQPILSQSSQVILAPCDNVENNSNNNSISDFEVPEEVCYHIDQNFNEYHDTKQNFESDQFVRMITRIKRSLEYLKDHHCNLNVSNTSSRVKYPLNYVLSYNNL